MIARLACIVLLTAPFAGCGTAHQSNSAQPAISNAPAPQEPTPSPVRVGRHGIGCRPYGRPNTIGPPSFSVNDVGKPDMPPLSSDELALLRRIQRYEHSPTLRFAFLNDDNSQFIVFDATQGPCFDAAPGYWVMNAATTNMYYEPGEMPAFVHAALTDDTTPGPWMSPPHDTPPER